MAKPLAVKIKETHKELQTLLSKQSSKTQRLKVQLLLTLQAHPEGISKGQLADLVSISHNTANTWRNLYLSSGIEGLLQEYRRGTKAAEIDPVTFGKIHARLSNHQNYFISYKELQQWVNAQCGKSIKYQALYNYINRKLPVRLKVPRKSHIQKDEVATAAFKKTVPRYKTY